VPSSEIAIGDFGIDIMLINKRGFLKQSFICGIFLMNCVKYSTCCASIIHLSPHPAPKPACIPQEPNRSRIELFSISFLYQSGVESKVEIRSRMIFALPPAVSSRTYAPGAGIVEVTY
jgi:hypothetical protein